MPPTLVATPSLLRWRIRRGLIQRALAERAGADRATVARLEQGGKARLDTIYKLAQALSLAPDELMQDSPDEVKVHVTRGVETGQ